MRSFRAYLPFLVVLLCASAPTATAEIRSLPLIITGVGVDLLQDTSVVTIDIEPRRCPNLFDAGRGGGQLSVAVLGSAGFDVTTVDAGSILLEGVAPIHASLRDVASPVSDGSAPCACTDAGPDGALDLLLKFPVASIVDALGPVDNGAVITLTLTGALLPDYGGATFSGSDCITVRLKGPHGK